MTAFCSGANALTSTPKNGPESPKFPACKRGSGLSEVLTTTNTRPVIVPARAAAGYDTSNFPPAACGTGAAHVLPVCRITVPHNIPINLIPMFNLIFAPPPVPRAYYTTRSASKVFFTPLTVLLQLVTSVTIAQPLQQFLRLAQTREACTKISNCSKAPGPSRLSRWRDKSHPP